MFFFLILQNVTSMIIWMDYIYNYLTNLILNYTEGNIFKLQFESNTKLFQPI